MTLPEFSKSTILASAALGALMCALPASAYADDTQDLEARIAALETMIAELRAEVSASREASSQAVQTAADAVETVETVEARVQTVAGAARTSDETGFMMGNTRVRFGGFVDVDLHVTDLSDGDFGSTSIARDFYIPGATPVGGADGNLESDVTAEATRFFFTTETPTEHGPIRGRIEMDFLGSVGGNERVSNSYNPRLRVAWLEHGNWRVGQDWSTFQNTSAIPESASFLVASDGMTFVRQPQIRYTNGNWQIALENTQTTTTPFGGGGRITTEDTAVPDLVVRYNHRGEFGNISFAGIARQLSTNTAGIDGDATGWGLSASGRLNLTETGDLRFNIVGGEGLGRYVGLNAMNAAVGTSTGDLEAISSLGGLVAWRQQVGEGRRFNVGYSYLEADNDVALTGSGVTRVVQSGFANYIVTVLPGVNVGGELLFGERELENGDSGTITRFTFSTKYAF